MEEARKQVLKDNFLKLIEEIQEACIDCHRSPEEVQLIAVSKKHLAEDIEFLAQLGQKSFGENYVQEALAKQKELSKLSLDWHFIGALQTNKVKFVLGNFSLIHSIDRLKLAQALNKKALDKKMVQDVLIQVNIGKEPQKAGVLPEDLEALVENILRLPGICLKGFMTLPPHIQDRNKMRNYFSMLRKLKEKMEQAFGKQFPHLSMGMTLDFKEAIYEGATLIRVGTKIFGPRP
ncbi:YggS family pyridoxal phosphate-dependent enzyme [Desulfonauticus submarinus]